MIDFVCYEKTMSFDLTQTWKWPLVLCANVMAVICIVSLAPVSFAAEVPAQGGSPRVAQLLAGETSIALVETTSKALLQTGQIDFPLSVEVDLGIEAERMSLDDALAPYGGPGTGPRYAIFLDVTRAKSRRRVLSLKSIPSTVFLGFVGRPASVDPDDPIARESFASSLALNGMQPQSYASQSQAIGSPLMYAYEFDAADIQAMRFLSVNTFVLDRKTRTYVVSNFDASEEHRFKVAYRMSHYDPKFNKRSKEYQREIDVDDMEKATFDIKLSSLIKDYLDKRRQAKNVKKNVDKLRLTLLKDHNANLKSVRANTFDARPLNDPRFNSVVAIYTGKYSMGSGFFITPDVVMTNWHVADEHRFVEMKMYDGRETYGTVLGKDALLDVALIRVQDRGNPVAFYTGRTIDVGQTVEAIGHPNRLEFSITRGVISAVRKHYSINLPAKSGDKVLYIQTDAPINHGNSGGPLFLGDRVIGMNTWGYDKSIAEGLNFSVHYSELLNFINEHLPGFYVSPAGDN